MRVDRDRLTHRCIDARPSRERETVAMSDEVFDLSKYPAHLGLGARIERLGEFDGTPDWYARYGEAHIADGVEGRLVSTCRIGRSVSSAAAPSPLPSPF